MEENKTAHAIMEESTHEPQKTQTNNNTEKEKPETALDNLLNYELNGGKDEKERERLYSLLSDDEKEEYKQAIKRLKDNANTLVNSIYDTAGLTEDLKQLNKSVITAFSSLKSTFNSTVPTEQMSQIISKLADTLEPVSEWNKETKAVLPYLEKELKKKEYNGATPDDVLSWYNYVGSFLPDVIESDKDDSAAHKAAREYFSEWTDKQKLKPEQARKAWENAKEAKEKAGLEKKVMALNYYAVPTGAGFEHALAISDDEKDRAHIVPIDLKMNEKPSEITVDEETGRLYYGGRQIELADFRELKKKGFQPINPNDYNIGLLNLMLSAYNDYHKNDLQVTADNSEIQKEELSVRRKDLFKYYKDHDSMDRLDRYIADFTKLSGLGAKLKENSKSSIPSYYPVFVFKGYNSISDTFDFEFVYFPKLRNAMLREAIQTKKDGTPKLKNSGQPYQRAYITELIHPEIVKEKNYAARQNVEIIIQVIEKTGGPLPIKKKNEKGKLQIVGYQKYATPNITLKELINRNYYLKNQLENQAETKSKNQLLKRCMNRTWYLLENMTDVKLKYPDIELPKLAQAGKNGKYYKYYKPTIKDIDSGLKYTFRHGEIAKDWR